MLSQHYTLDKSDAARIQRIRDLAAVPGQATEFIITLCGEYVAALDIMRESGIQTRLDDEMIRMDLPELLASLRLLAWHMGGDLEDAEHGRLK